MLAAAPDLQISELLTTTEGAEAVGGALSVTTVLDTVLLSAAYTFITTVGSKNAPRNVAKVTAKSNLGVIYPTTALYANIAITIAAIISNLFSFTVSQMYFIELLL